MGKAITHGGGGGEGRVAVRQEWAEGSPIRDLSVVLPRPPPPTPTITGRNTDHDLVLPASPTATQRGSPAAALHAAAFFLVQDFGWFDPA